MEVQSDLLEKAVLPSVTVLIPAYNEELRIGAVLSELKDYIKGAGVDWNIIVSIDGSDGTEDVVKKMSKDFPFILYDKSKSRSGKGYAIKRVVEKSNKEYTLIMDADRSICLPDILASLSDLDGFDVIIFNRYSNNMNSIPFARRIASRAFNIIVKVTLGIQVEDTQSGYKLMKTHLAKEAFRKISVTDATYDIALLYYIKQLGGSFKEVSVKYNHDQSSKFNVISLSIGMGISLLAFRIRHSRFYKYVPTWATELYQRKFRWF